MKSTDLTALVAAVGGAIATGLDAVPEPYNLIVLVVAFIAAISFGLIGRDSEGVTGIVVKIRDQLFSDEVLDSIAERIKTRIAPLLIGGIAFSLAACSSQVPIRADYIGERFEFRSTVEGPVHVVYEEGSGWEIIEAEGEGDVYAGFSGAYQVNDQSYQQNADLRLNLSADTDGISASAEGCYKDQGVELVENLASFASGEDVDLFPACFEYESEREWQKSETDGELKRGE